MSEDKMDFWKALSVLLLIGVIILAANIRIRHLEKELDKYRNAPADTVTVIRHDTIKIDSPVPVYKYIKEKEYVYVSDTLTLHDTVTSVIQLPREYLVYKDTSYRAVVSGVQPRLDSIEVYQRTQTTTVTKYIEVKKKTRWGVGVQAGYGYNGSKWSPYLGAGVQYNILSW